MGNYVCSITHPKSFPHKATPSESKGTLLIQWIRIIENDVHALVEFNAVSLKTT